PLRVFVEARDPQAGRPDTALACAREDGCRDGGALADDLRALLDPADASHGAARAAGPPLELVAAVLVGVAAAAFAQQPAESGTRVVIARVASRALEAPRAPVAIVGR